MQKLDPQTAKSCELSTAKPMVEQEPPPTTKHKKTVQK